MNHLSLHPNQEKVLCLLLVVDRTGLGKMHITRLLELSSQAGRVKNETPRSCIFKLVGSVHRMRTPCTVSISREYLAVKPTAPPEIKDKLLTAVKLTFREVRPFDQG